MMKSHLPPCNFSHSCNKLCHMPMAVSNKAQKGPTGSGHIHKGGASLNVLIIAVKVKAAEVMSTLDICAENIAVQALVRVHNNNAHVPGFMHLDLDCTPPIFVFKH